MLKRLACPGEGLLRWRVDGLLLARTSKKKKVTRVVFEPERDS